SKDFFDHRFFAQVTITSSVRATAHFGQTNSGTLAFWHLPLHRFHCLAPESLADARLRRSIGKCSGLLDPQPPSLGSMPCSPSCSAARAIGPCSESQRLDAGLSCRAWTFWKTGACPARSP